MFDEISLRLNCEVAVNQVEFLCLNVVYRITFCLSVPHFVVVVLDASFTSRGFHGCDCMSLKINWCKIIQKCVFSILI